MLVGIAYSKGRVFALPFLLQCNDLEKSLKIFHFVLAYRNKTCYCVSIHKNKEVTESYEQKRNPL